MPRTTNPLDVLIDEAALNLAIEELGEELDGEWRETPQYMLDFVEAGYDVEPLLELELVLIISKIV